MRSKPARNLRIVRQWRQMEGEMNLFFQQLKTDMLKISSLFNKPSHEYRWIEIEDDDPRGGFIFNTDQFDTCQKTGIIQFECKNVSDAEIEIAKSYFNSLQERINRGLQK